MTLRRLALPVILITLLVGGCDEATRDEIGNAVGSAVDQAESAVEEAGSEVLADDTAEPAPEPTEEEPAPEPTAEEPVEEASEPVDIPWTLIIVLLLAAVLLWALVAAGRRRGAAHARRDRLRDIAIAEGEWLLGAARERAAGVDASARARDVRMRLDRLTDAVQQLRVGAKEQVVAAADDLQTSARQLADALIARLDDALAQRDSGTGLGIDELTQRLRVALDTFATTLGRRR